MKLSDFGILFSLIFICVTLSSDIKQDIISEVSTQQIAYNNAIDTAVDDSLFMLVEADDGRDLLINTDKAVDTFFRSIGINLEGDCSKVHTAKLKEYVPVMVFLLNDGYYLYYHNISIQNGVLFDTFARSSKKYYEYNDEIYKYRFQLDEKVSIYENGNKYVGEETRLADVYKDSLLANERYEEIKHQIITDIITEDMKIYCEKYDKDMEFSFPYASDTNWTRSIKDVGMLVVFSGYPYSISSMGEFSKVAFGGARIWKKN